VLLALLLWLSGCASLPPAKLAQRPIQIWGEVHDNPAHHASRAEWIEARVRAGRPPVLVFEQFDRLAQAALDRWWLDGPHTVAALQSLGAPGWDWPLYAPLLEVAVRHRLPVIGGNLSRNQAIAVMRGGLSALPDGADAARLGLPPAWPAPLQARLEQDMIDSHCGKLPASVAPRMVLAQAARDAWLADAVLTARERFPGRDVILLTGNGHALRDTGVPVFLERRGVPADQIAVLLLTEGSGAPAPADAVLSFAPVDRPDPCR
jgi:uncharacterized iron-regulated protein